MADTMILKVNTGAVNVELHDEDGEKLGVFKFNPTDTGILTRYESVVDFFNSFEFERDMSAEETAEKVKEITTNINNKK